LLNSSSSDGQIALTVLDHGEVVSGRDNGQICLRWSFRELTGLGLNVKQRKASRLETSRSSALPINGFHAIREIEARRAGPLHQMCKVAAHDSRKPTCVAASERPG
jgi:hypothetical protein